jgi:Gas vesicle synthesis protein GvpL/GvpF
MSARGDGSEALRQLLEETAREDAEALLEDARSAAYARAREALESALYEELLDAATQLRAATELTHEPSAARPNSQRLWWVYCVLSSGDAGAAADSLEGVEPGTHVEVVADDRLAALVSPVPGSDYGDERLRQHLEDLTWVERVARAHESVLEAVLGRATLVPLRLCTLYRDMDGVRRLLIEHGPAFAEALAAIDGCEEWGVKVFAAAGAGTDPPAPEAPAKGENSEGTGAAYLAGRRRERDTAQRAREARSKCAEEVHRRLSSVARAAVTNPPQRPEAHGRTETMLLNGAYLVARERVGDLHDAVRELSELCEAAHVSIEPTGPWPPYNFVSGPAGVIP